MAETIHIETLPNGLVVLAQEMHHVGTASMMIRTGVSSARDPIGCEGAASVGDEWWQRGAGDYDSRGLNDAFDRLGCTHSSAASREFTMFSGSMLGRNLRDVLALYADVIRRPAFPEDHFESCRDLVLQELGSLDDMPAKKATRLAYSQFIPAPYGRFMEGTPESLGNLTPAMLREHLMGQLTPKGTIIALAGRFDFAEALGWITEQFGDWDGPDLPDLDTTPAPGGFVHEEKDSAQTHIAFGFPGLKATDPDFYNECVALSVLSGGTSSRLFTEVREKRGLVYHVSTKQAGTNLHPMLLTYAASVPEKVQETLDVIVTEIRKLVDGISDEELARAKTQLKSSVIMECDSTGVRAARLANLWMARGEIITLEESKTLIDAVTADDVHAYLESHPPRDFAGAFIGPEMPDVSALQ